MSDEVYITKPTAILLTEKGYINTMMRGYYTKDSPYWGSTYLTKELYESKTGWFAPTQAVVQKWLREEHDIHISIELYDKRNHENVVGWFFDIQEISNLKLLSTIDVVYLTYEDALEQGLRKGLELI